MDSKVGGLFARAARIPQICAQLGPEPPRPESQAPGRLQAPERLSCKAAGFNGPGRESLSAQSVNWADEEADSETVGRNENDELPGASLIGADDEHLPSGRQI